MVTLKHVLQSVIASIVAIAALLSLPGCAQKQRQNPYLRPLCSYIDFQETNENITLQAKKLSVDDCKSLFGKRARLLFKRKRRRPALYPIQLSITNTSENPVCINPDNITLELTPINEVVSRLEHNATMHIVGGVAVAIITAGILATAAAFGITASLMYTALFGGLGATVTAPLFFAGASAAVITPFFLIIGTPVISANKGIASMRENKIIKHELSKVSLDHRILINRFETIDTLIFIPKHKYKPEFSVTVSNTKQDTVASFDITLKPDFDQR